ncbi:(Fe-S)-binding protein [Polycladidibacter hongkongensis]|uniref:(Fe-S)-binding protein n=1 Tax=Polycladidibacter hongkongensis TaxID=1647556 RepID=UPI00082C8E48|nr:(Fe-S)-binding protein [Pseudovibrio hongkongensis]
MAASRKTNPSVGLFSGCACSLFRPSIVSCAAELLLASGAQVEVPAAQPCCGLTALKSGDRQEAVALARTLIQLFDSFDYVVSPSVFCARVLRETFPILLRDDPKWAARAQGFAKRSFELCDFLARKQALPQPERQFHGSLVFLEFSDAPTLFGSASSGRNLLSNLRGVHVKTIPEVFPGRAPGAKQSIDIPELSDWQMERLLEDLRHSGAGTFVAGDLSILMEVANGLRRSGSAIEVRHVAEVLAGRQDLPAIGARRAQHIAS